MACDGPDEGRPQGYLPFIRTHLKYFPLASRPVVVKKRFASTNSRSRVGARVHCQVIFVASNVSSLDLAAIQKRLAKPRRSAALPDTFKCRKRLPSFHNESTSSLPGANIMLFPSRSSNITLRDRYYTPVKSALVKSLNAHLKWSHSFPKSRETSPHCDQSSRGYRVSTTTIGPVKYTP